VREQRELRLAADPDGARSAAEATRALLAGCDPLDANACELAVMEACANVVEHAYGGAGGPLRVVLRRGRGRFSAAVCDMGPPFAGGDSGAGLPAADAEGGRGLVLLGLCMHRHGWRRVDSENRLLMSRALPEAA
jgi:anti-sigma regulatory factor (Ser/Thr protein kinase)